MWTPAKPHDSKQEVGNVLSPTTPGKEALEHHYRAMERPKLEDWAGFGGELDQLRAVLEAAGSRDEPWGLLPLAVEPQQVVLGEAEAADWRIAF